MVRKEHPKVVGQSGTDISSSTSSSVKPPEKELQHQKYRVDDTNNSNNDNDDSRIVPLPGLQTYFKTPHDEEMIRMALQKSSTSSSLLSSYFTCLDDEQVTTFIQSVQCKTYQPGEVIILEGCIDNNTNNDRKSDAAPAGVTTIVPTTTATTNSNTKTEYDDENDHLSSTSKATATEFVQSTDSIPSVPVVTETAQTTNSSTGISIQQQKPIYDHDDVNNNNHLLKTSDAVLVQPLHIDLSTNETDPNEESKQNNIDINRVHENDVSNQDYSSNQNNNDSDCYLLPSENRTTQLESSSSSSSSLILMESPTNQASRTLQPPIPPQSNIPRCIYIIKKGTAQIWYQKQQQQQHSSNSNNNIDNNNYLVNTIGPGTIFGEGGFLFGRQHSASVVASPKAAKVAATTTKSISDTEMSPNATEADSNNNDTDESLLECWVMDIQTFRDYVLPSTNLRRIFQKYARRLEDSTNTSISDRDSLTDEQSNQLYVTMEDFLVAINEHQQLDSTRNMNLATKLYDALIRLRLLETRASTNNITIVDNTRSTKEEVRFDLKDFCFFFTLLARPDPEIDLAFLLMDEQQTGYIHFDQLRTIIQPLFPNLNFHTQFFQRYFGKNGDQCIRSKIFSQFIVDLQYEIGQQAYIRALQQQEEELKNHASGMYNRSTDGYLYPNEMIRILTKSCGWILPTGIIHRLESVYCRGNTTNLVVDNDLSAVIKDKHIKQQGLMPQKENILSGEQYFSYGDFLAFQEVLGNLHFICTLIRRALDFKNGGSISADDFKVTNREYGLGGRLSRRQVEIIFDIFDLDNDGYISYNDVVDVCGSNFSRQVVPVIGQGDKLSFIAPSPIQPVSSDALKGKDFDIVKKISTEMKNFGIASLVGGLSVFCLHPFDLVKTRLMNQRRGSLHLYSGPMDCMQQVFRREGVKGILRGVQPHILGVAMERSIKLQVHHLMQQAFHAIDDEKDFNREPSLLFEALAGGCAGACQLLVTNPMEISSIRLQMQGETARLLRDRGIEPPPPSNLIKVIKDLGFPGVYRGASACLIRDVPFSAIFFPSYVLCKETLVQHNSTFTGKATAADIFYAGTMAGIPASFLTTPADVVKCRLQSLPRPGEQSYAGIRDCVTKVYYQEGISAFFQGSSMRMLRIAPQFGLSLTIYENFANFFGFEKARRPPSNLPISTDDYLNAFPRRPPNEIGILEQWVQILFGEK